MTGTQVRLFTKAYLDGIVDVTTPIFFSDPVVMTKFDDKWTFAGFYSINILDKIGWIIFSILITLSITVIVILFKWFVPGKNNLMSSIADSVFIMIGISLGKGDLVTFINHIYLFH